MPPPGDYHVHTRFSDGEGEPAQCVERALALGLPEIGITDHLTPSCLGAEGDWSIGHERLGEYVDAVRDAAARYPEITVLLGVEADYVPGAEDELAELLGAHPFDYVVGGLHFVDGFPFDEPAMREDASWGDAGSLYRRYYALESRAAASGLFDVVAHLETVCSEITVPREAMGLGDVKFMAAIGAFLGWEAAVFSLVVAAMIGAAYGGTMVALHKQKWSGRLYFGPFLAAAATIWIFAGPELVAWYLRFSQELLNRLLGH